MQPGRGDRMCSPRSRNPRFATCGTSIVREVVEFAPNDGAGMGTECACAAVTLASGTAVTFTRGSSGTCVNSSGTGFTCGNNLPVVESRNGVLGLRIENAATNVLLRSAQLDNAAWTATATVTADQYTGPWGATMEQLDDEDAANSLGVNQTVTTAFGSDQYWMASCWVRAGTQSSMRLKLSGTGATAGAGWTDRPGQDYR